MKLADVPEGAQFLDVDGIPVARLPDGCCLGFEKRTDSESHPFPNESKAGEEGDALTREEFASWLETGFNKFDVRG